MSGTPTLLIWTWRKRRRFPSKKAAEAKLKVWKRWYERCGWTVTGNASRGYIAYAPDYDASVHWRVPSSSHFEPNPKMHAAGIRDPAHYPEPSRGTRLIGT